MYVVERICLFGELLLGEPGLGPISLVGHVAENEEDCKAYAGQQNGLVWRHSSKELRDVRVSI